MTQNMEDKDTTTKAVSTRGVIMTQHKHRVVVHTHIHKHTRTHTITNNDAARRLRRGNNCIPQNLAGYVLDAVYKSTVNNDVKSTREIAGLANAAQKRITQKSHTSPLVKLQATPRGRKRGGATRNSTE